MEAGSIASRSGSVIETATIQEPRSHFGRTQVCITASYAADVTEAAQRSSAIAVPGGGPMLNTSITTAMAVLVIVGSTACATKGFVRTNVRDVQEKVDTLSTSVEETQERVRKNESQISDVGKEAQAAQNAAQQASQSAAAAAELAKKVQSRTEAVEKAGQRLVYEVVMSEQEGGFRFGSSELPEQAKKQLDELVAKLTQQPRNLFITIEGHTDSVGPSTVNDRIGLERAMAVEQYLYQQHQIPLQKMEAISYGEENPVAPNTTREGRAENRRIEIKVLG
jgi:outer membrane protein OmpA-like peptidoglycan-associated protein